MTPDNGAGQDSLQAAAREELEFLWDDLHNARRTAANGEWSIRFDELVHRIGVLTRHVGPTPWEKVQIPLLEDGVYQRIHADLEILVEVDMQHVRQVRADIEARIRRPR